MTNKMIVPNHNSNYLQTYDRRADRLPQKSHQQSSMSPVAITHANYQTEDMTNIARAAIALGFDIDYNDNIPLFIEAASWLGVPYRHARNDKDGTDCSGLSYAIFKKLYGITLDRRSDGQFYENCTKVSKNNLQTGDLVFFIIGGHTKISHVGIYLKNNKFIHASSMRGVVVNDLNEDYYRKYFYTGGRVKKIQQ